MSKSYLRKSKWSGSTLRLFQEMLAGIDRRRKRRRRPQWTGSGHRRDVLQEAS